MYISYDVSALLSDHFMCLHSLRKQTCRFSSLIAATAGGNAKRPQAAMSEEKRLFLKGSVQDRPRIKITS